MIKLTQVTSIPGVYTDSNDNYYLSPYRVKDSYGMDITNDPDVDYYYNGNDIIPAINLVDLIKVLDPSDIAAMLSLGFQDYALAKF